MSNDQGISQELPKSEPTITEIMKCPSKVVLLRVRYFFFLILYFVSYPK